MCVLTRRTFWLSAIPVLAILGGVAMLEHRSRIVQANYDRIQWEMMPEEVFAILGQPEWPECKSRDRCGGPIDIYIWRPMGMGPNRIVIGCQDGRVRGKNMHFATAWETMIWYTKQGATKIGIQLD